MSEAHSSTQLILILVLLDLFTEVLCHRESTHRALVHAIAATATATTTATGESHVVHIIGREYYRVVLIVLEAVYHTLHGVEVIDVVGVLLCGTSVAKVDI